MLTSKQRSEFRAQANGMEVTLMVGKGGVSEQVIAEAEILLESKELVKGKVLETALMSAREVSDAICEATGADGVSTVGATFVIWRKSKKLEQQAKAAVSGTAKAKKKVNPVRAGRQKRKAAAKAERERRNEYFRQQAIEKAIERDRERQLRKEK